MEHDKTPQDSVELWMSKHPDDEPCPTSPESARAWRVVRDLEDVPVKQLTKWKRYAAAMAERRAHEAKANEETSP